MVRKFFMLILPSNCLVALALLISFVLPTTALGHELGTQYTYVLGGDECDVRNPATENAAALRKVDGTLENTSDDLTSTISCPIPVTYETFGIGFLYTDIEIFFLNSHPTEEQKFRCNVFGFDVSDGPSFGFVRYWNSSDIDSGGEGSVQFRYGREIPDYFVVGISGFSTRRPTITCGLPPKSTILSVFITAELEAGS